MTSHSPMWTALVSLVAAACGAAPAAAPEPVVSEGVQGTETTPVETPAGGKEVEEAKPVPPPEPIPAVRVEADTPLHALVTKGKCYRNTDHDFVVCAKEGKRHSAPMLLVGRGDVLHLTEPGGLTSRGNGLAARFNDSPYFTYTRRSSPRLAFLNTVGAPAYVKKGKKRFLACGKELMPLTPMKPKDAKALLIGSKLHLDPPRYQAQMRKSKDGTIIAEIQRHGGGLPRMRELHVGKLGDLRKTEPVKRSMYKDGGSLRFQLEGGASVFIPAVMGMVEFGEPDPGPTTLPDGTIVHGKAMNFRWGTFKPSKSAAEQKLYALERDEAVTLLRALNVPASDPPSARLPACSAALGVPPDEKAITDPDGSPRAFGTCRKKDRAACLDVQMRLARPGYKAVCRESECFIEPELGRP